MTDNFTLIEDFLSKDADFFINPMDQYYYFYLVTLIKGKTDGDKDVKGHDRTRIIKTYEIGSITELNNKKQEITSICNAVGCRAMISLNPKSLKKVKLELAQRIIENEKNGNISSILNLVNSAYNANDVSVKGKEKLWLVDIDNKERDEVMFQLINYLEPKIGNKVKAIIPSKKGYHLITTPFRLDKFRLKYPYIEVHKHCLTNLYIPA